MTKKNSENQPTSSEILEILQNEDLDKLSQTQITALINFFFALPSIQSRIKPYFQKVLKDDLLQLIKKIQIKKVEKGHILYKDNDEINEYFIILKGTVGLFSPDPDNIYIKNMVLESKYSLQKSQVIYDTEIKDWQFLILDNLTYVKNTSVYEGEEVGTFSEQISQGHVKQDQACATLSETYYIQLEGSTYFEHLGKHLQRLETVYDSVIDHYYNIETKNAIKMAYFAQELYEPTSIEPIFKEGDNPDGIYIVWQGEVQLKKKILHPTSQNIYNIQIYTVKKGDLFGADEIHQKSTRVFSAYCHKENKENPVQVYFVDKKHISSNLVIKPKQMRTGEFLGKCIKQQLEYIGYLEKHGEMYVEQLQNENENQILPIIEAEKYNLYKLQEYNLLEYQNLSDAASQIQFSEIKDFNANIGQIYQTASNHFDRSAKNFQRKRFEKDRNFVQILKVPEKQMFTPLNGKKPKNVDNLQNKYITMAYNRPRASSHAFANIGQLDLLNSEKPPNKLNKRYHDSTSQRKQSLSLQGSSQLNQGSSISSPNTHFQYSQLTQNLYNPKQTELTQNSQSYLSKPQNSSAPKNFYQNFPNNQKQYLENKIKDFKLNKLPVTLFISKDMQEKKGGKNGEKISNQSSTIFTKTQKLDHMPFEDLKSTVNSCKRQVLNSLPEPIRTGTGRMRGHSHQVSQRSYQIPEIRVRQNSNDSKTRPCNLLQFHQLQNQNKIDQKSEINSSNRLRVQSQHLPSDESFLPTQNSQFTVLYDDNLKPYDPKDTENLTEITPLNKAILQNQQNMLNFTNSMQEQPSQNEEDFDESNSDFYLTEEEKRKKQELRAKKQRLLDLNNTWMDKIKKTPRKKYSISKENNKQLMAAETQDIFKSTNRKQVRFNNQQLSLMKFQEQLKHSRHQKMLQLKFEYSKDRDYLSCNNKINTIDYKPRPKHMTYDYDYKNHLSGGEPFRRAPMLFLKD